MQIEDPTLINQYYQALINRNPEYLGIFYAGVKTTSIFCIATCRAKKPKKENIDFFSSVNEALENGFRPCKICKPTENAHQAPQEVEKAIQLVRNNLKEKRRHTWRRVIMYLGIY